MSRLIAGLATALWLLALPSHASATCPIGPECTKVTLLDVVPAHPVAGTPMTVHFRVTTLGGAPVTEGTVMTPM